MKFTRTQLAVLLSILSLEFSLRAAGSDPLSEVKTAIENLSAQSSYSWTALTKSEPSPVRLGPTEGKAEKEGFTHFKFTLEGNPVEAALKGPKSVIKTESAWESSGELIGDRQWIARRLRAFRAPVAEAEDLLAKSKSIKRESRGLYSGVLTPEAVKQLLLDRSRAAAQVRNPKTAKGWVKLWVKDGQLAKYEFHFEGKLVLLDHNQEFAIDRTTTVEIRHVGSTKVDLPPEAREKLL